MPPMDIDEFYEADPRRRASAELELGTEWLDKDGVRHELNYVEDTGELYVLREPVPHVTEDPFGGLHVSAPPGYEDKMTVHVIAKIPTVDDVHRILQGWQEAMQSESGADWLGQRLREAGVGGGPDGRPDRRLAVQAGGSRSSILASSWVAMLSVAMELSSSIMLPGNASFESRYMTMAKRKPENTS